MGWGWTAFYWYRAHKRTEQRRREMAAMETRLRAEMGLPPMVAYPAPALAYHRPRRQVHIGRWVVLAVVVLVLLLVLAFLVALVVFGLQHGYIYPARHG